MIEVNLHPGAEEKQKAGGGLLEGLSLPEIGGLGGLEGLRENPWQTAMIASLIVVPLVVGAMWYTQRNAAQQLEQRLETARQDSARLADLRVLMDSLQTRQEEIRSRISLVRELDQGRYVWPHLMNQISRALPRDTWLLRMSRQGEDPVSVSLQGRSLDPMLITEFIRNLEASQYVAEVQFGGSSRTTFEGINVHQFTMTVTYSPAAPENVQRITVAGGS